MPNRIVREGILTSEAVNGLNWAEEVFYRRLLSVVDDFGRYYATPKLLRAACYPLHIDKVSDSDIGKWLSACETAALVRVYPASDGKRYLEVQNFKQQQRAKESKFPSPDERLLSTCIAGAQQTLADAHLGVFGVGDVFGDEGGGSAEPPSDSPPPVISIPLNDKTEYGVTQAEVNEWASAYPAVDVVQQLREMRAWSVANPSQRKTRRGFNAFVVRWLSKEQDKGGRPGYANPADNKTTTVPAKPGRDPTLVRLEQEALSATKPPPEIRERMAQLTRGAA
jgi:hypothetical protein